MQHFKHAYVILDATGSANVASGAHLEGGQVITLPSNAQNLKVTSEIRYWINITTGYVLALNLEAFFNDLNNPIVSRKYGITASPISETITLDTTNLFRSGKNVAVVNLASAGGATIRANWTLVVEYDAPEGTPPPDVQPIPSPLDFSSIMNQLFMFMFIMMIFSTLPTMMTGLARAAPKAAPTVVKIIKRVRRRPKEEVEEEVEEEE